MHVVLSGYYGFDNCGDEAILYSIIYALKKVRPAIKITVLSQEPVKTKNTYQVDSVNRRNLKEIRKVLRECDGLISGGGSLLQDVTGPLTIPYYTGIIQMAKIYRKPVFIYAQGMGPIKHKFSKWIVRAALNKADQITVRDDQSKYLLHTIGIKHNAQIAPDPVLGIDSSSFHSEWLIKHRISNPYITVSVRNWKDYTSYKHQIARCLDLLVNDQFDIIFVPMHGRQDLDASLEVASFMKNESHIAPCEASIQEKVAIIGQSQLLIGMRLHSLIFSATRSIPFVAISYDPKIDSFAKIYKQPVIGDVMTDNWNEYTLYNQVKLVLEKEQEHKQRIIEKVMVCRQEAMQTARGVIQLLS